MKALCRLTVALLTGVGTAVPPSFAQCPSDLNADGRTDGTDLSVVLLHWGACSSGESCSGDINDDGLVNGTDLTALLAGWGSCVTVPSWATLIEAYPDPQVVHSATLRQSIVATGFAWRVLDTATQIELVLIPPGTYQRGCSPSQQYSCFDREFPVHQVTLTQPFYMGRYEVTQAQWQARMGSNPSFFQYATAEVPASQVSNRPVEQVSWNMTPGFLAATGMRLPTEAEWEYAYRAGTTTAFHSMPGYPDGTNDDSLLGTIAWFWTGNCTSGAICQTRPVGGKAGNGFGLHDMSGNVSEWVHDRLGTYPSAPQTNPTGPASGTWRVVRGGSWGGDTNGVRSSFRGYGGPEETGTFIGLRVARTP